jgi:aldose 1-epimerase
VVLGFEKLEDYIAHSPHFGATAGQFANRIAGGCFTLDGVAHQLPRNQEGKHSLHGGGRGFGKRPWALANVAAHHAVLTWRAESEHAQYPGMIDVYANIVLGNGGTLHIEMSAAHAPGSTDATIVNLCHHSYFNLGATPDVLDHELLIDARHFTPVDADLIPTGEILHVAGTPFDRRVLAPIHRADPANPAQPFRTDHNFVLHRHITGVSTLDPAIPLHRAAVLAAPRGDLTLEVWTDAPGLQAYDGHKVNTPVPGLSGAPYGPFAGICLESQNFPDAPNHPHFPSAVLRPGQKYRHVVEYRFLA